MKDKKCSRCHGSGEITIILPIQIPSYIDGKLIYTWARDVEWDVCPDCDGTGIGT